MSRTHRKNALTISMYIELADALRTAKTDRTVRVVVITGDGDAFTSGNDLADFMKDPPQNLDTPVFDFLREISNFPKPIIAAVNGAAVGIGTTMLLHCDLVYAAEGVKLQLPFIRLGLVPEAGASWLIPHAIGHRLAAELLMLGEHFSSERGEVLGFVNKCLKPEELMSYVYERAETLAALPPEAMRQTKALLKDSDAEQLQRVMVSEGELFIKRLNSPETAEALQAFFQKRKPNFNAFS